MPAPLTGLDVWAQDVGITVTCVKTGEEVVSAVKDCGSNGKRVDLVRSNVQLTPNFARHFPWWRSGI